ncbi:MAG TPA: family 20 glycosylhydrolase, partial [Gemmatimonadaceae bacterium]|nr:family 20 glycosylhydrolase [Gemmatimonadaceae bacterium]
MSSASSMTTLGLRVAVLPLLAWAAAGCARASRTEPAPAPLTPDRYAILPQPAHVVARPGELRLDGSTRIVLSDTSAALRTIAELFAVPLRAASGLPLPVVQSSAADSPGAIVMTLAAAASPDSARQRESYRLVVTERGATLSAPTPAGLLNGIQTIRQLLPPDAARGVRATSPWQSLGAASPAATPPTVERWSLPAVEIDDAPRFAYRGILLDVGRYYFPPEFLKELVDLLALYKYNRLHLHFTDDQGWRIEIKKYPRLTSVGAWRKETQVAQNFEPYVGDKKPHGGFYTQEQLRDLVAYAAARNVTIVPEIEMPGHAGAAIAAYPELACTPGPFA